MTQDEEKIAIDKWHKLVKEKRINSDAILIDCMYYMRTLPDKAFDLAVVDPPYGTVQGGYTTKGHVVGGSQYAAGKKYNTALWKQPAPGKEYFEELFRVAKNVIVWGGNNFTKFLPPSTCWIVWDKGVPEGISFSGAEMAWCSMARGISVCRLLWSGFRKCERVDRIHPTQKPVALYDWIFERFAKPGDKILDTHLGSGSSRIAAYKAGLDFVGCEIEEAYFDDQEKRFGEFRESWLFS